MNIADEDRDDIQGLVTSGFAHLPYAGFVFLEIVDAAAAKAWLGRMEPGISTAASWAHAADGTKILPHDRLSIAFGYDALRLLGLPETALSTFPTEFVNGMASRADVLGDTGDSAPEHWELGGPSTPPLHVLLVAHAPDEAAVQAQLEELEREANAGGLHVVSVERGARDARSHEQFGFAGDGLSEPQIEGIRSTPTPDQDVVPAGEFLLGYLNALGAYPVSPAVAAAADPGRLLADYPDGALPGYRDFGRNGSFLVYRKLYEDVAAFWNFMAEACRAHDPTLGGDAHALAAASLHLAAKLMGRWPSGAPVVLTPDHDDVSIAHANGFGYLSDLAGLGCPVGAHIRRANPRDSLHRIDDTAAESLTAVSQHRILRRGIRYGSDLYDLSSIDDGYAPFGLVDDGKERGLHFVALNSDNQRQFEFIQQSWLDKPSFNGIFPAKDPVVGDNDGTGTATVPATPLRWRIGGVPRFVSVRGGAYWFLPSRRSLRYLAGLGR